MMRPKCVFLTHLFILLRLETTFSRPSFSPLILTRIPHQRCLRGLCCLTAFCLKTIFILCALACTCGRAHMCALPRGGLPVSNCRMRSSTPPADSFGANRMFYDRKTAALSSRHLKTQPVSPSRTHARTHAPGPAERRCSARSHSAGVCFFFVITARETTPVATFPVFGLKI